MSTPTVAVAITADPTAVRQALEQASSDVRRFSSGAQTELARTGAAARASTLNFQQLRGGVASLAQAAVGQAVPGLTSLAGVLGTFAIGSAWTVGVLAGIAAIALAWKGVTKEAREAKEAHKELVRDLERDARKMFVDPRVALRQEIATREARNSQIQAMLAGLRQPQFREITDAKTGLVISREQIPVAQQQATIKKLSEEFQQNAQIRAAALKEIADLDKAAAKDRADLLEAELERQADLRRAARLIDANEREALLRIFEDQMKRAAASAVQRRGEIEFVNGRFVSKNAPAPLVRNAPLINAPPDRSGWIPPSRGDQVLAALGGGRGVASAALSPFAAQGGFLGTFAQGGLSFAGGGPAGLAAFGISTVGGLLANMLGDSQDREREIYQGTLRAMREAREESQPVVNVYIPRNIFDPRNGNSRELWAAIAKEAGVTRTGGYNFRNWSG